ncbi:MAG: excinuclease ABC subunit UvrA [Mucinivorans sp.]
MIKVEGARVHNLKNIDVQIPSQSLCVITGLSGSGKSSLAFDTIYAEGQRRYLETLSAYSRQFMGSLERPDVDKISGLSPVIAIEQKTSSRNPRSTVGTVTEINDFLRLLFARASIAYSKATGQAMVHYTDDQIIAKIFEHYSDKKIAILAPLIKGRKGHYRELFETLRSKGFIYARIDGKIVEMTHLLQLDRYKIHNIELVVDRLMVDIPSTERLAKSVSDSFRYGKGSIAVVELFADKTIEEDRQELHYFSRSLMCPTTGIAYQEPQPATFSFNSPLGACPVCSGLGVRNVFDITKIIPNPKLSIERGAIEPLGKKGKGTLVYAKIEALAHRYGYTVKTPINEWDEDALSALVEGENEPLRITAASGTTYMSSWEGVIAYLENQVDEGPRGAKWKEQFIEKQTCTACSGTRLKEDSLFFKVDGFNIAQLSALSIIDLHKWAMEVEERLEKKQKMIAHEILREIQSRLGFLIDVGLGYLSLNRSSRTLSGGESQRIRLATQVGSELVNVLYILDEPSIGLHQRDNIKLINSLRSLRDAGNSVIVVEHDEQMIRSADWIVDVGPGAGVHGGEIVAVGTLDEVLEQQTLTTDYLKGLRQIEIPAVRRKGNGEKLVLKGARGNNLKNITVHFPLGTFIAVAGVSGSGKSTLINATLRPILNREFYNSYDQPLDYDTLTGIDKLDKLIVVDQSPIGRSPRSNPATYSGVFGDIRTLFEHTQDAQIRGYKAGRFSFNVKGGRCEECRGAGVSVIEMNFLPDVYVTCRSCGGYRYNIDTLDVRFRGKNIDQVLAMTINQACDFFEAHPAIFTKLHAMQQVGLGYLTLGQPCTTLSGGESQRLKLASELSKRDTGRTMYLLDEPTTGLHFEDVKVLLEVLQKLVDRGNTVLVIEHNLDVIKVADYVIDIGPEGGQEGGFLIGEGTPEKIARIKESATGKFLKTIL